MEAFSCDPANMQKHVKYNTVLKYQIIQPFIMTKEG